MKRLTLGLSASLLATLGCVSSEKRPVIFDPVTAPLMQPQEPYVKGGLDLVVQIKNANPICASYVLSLENKDYKPLPAISALTPGEPQGKAATMTFEPTGCTAKTGFDLATCVSEVASKAAEDIQQYQQVLQKEQHALDDVWLQCDAPTALQPDTLKAQSLALQNIAGKLRDGGLDRAVSEGMSASSATFAAARSLRTEQATITGRLTEAKNTLQRAKDALGAATEAKKKPDELKPLQTAVKEAQAKVDQLQGSFDQLDKLSAVLTDWNTELAKLAAALKEATAKQRGEVAAALALVPPSVGKIDAPALLAERHFEPNQVVTVSVTETRRVAGKLVEKGAERSLGTVQLAVVRPIWVDVGVGPAFTFESEKTFGVGSDKKVAITGETANFDGTVTLSAYVWGPRYLDNTFFSPIQFAPRPMIGMSMRQPFTSLYFGVQLDPIQFLDISVGGRVYSSTELVGKKVGDPADLDTEGKALSPTTQSKASLAFFTSISASSDLFATWIKALVK